MHGGIFAPLTNRLKNRFRLHLVDLPGHGHSRGDWPLALAECARQINEAVPPAVWIGWSLGGLVCLEAMQRCAAQVKGLVLIASNPKFVHAADWPHGVEREVFNQFGEGLQRDYRRTIERFLALEAHGSDHATAELRELKAQVFERGEPSLQALQHGLAVLGQTDFRTCLATLKIPSLWIAGRRDRLVPASALQWAAECSRNGSYMDLSAGHAPFLGHADTVADAISVFANRIFHDTAF